MNIEITYRYREDILPSVEQQLHILWKVAKVLESAGMALDQWCPPADTPENALKNQAFEEEGPSKAAIAIFSEEDRREGDGMFRSIGVWNGLEDDGGAVMLFSVQTKGTANSNFTLDADGIPGLEDKKGICQIIENLEKIFSPPFIEVAPAGADMKKVFPDKPGVGWMLYLSEILTPAQVPEAPELIRVLGNDGKQKGTIIVSVPHEPFSVKNKEHIKVANAIEIRLVDQDLLPCFSSL